MIEIIMMIIILLSQFWFKFNGSVLTAHTGWSVASRWLDTVCTVADACWQILLPAVAWHYNSLDGNIAFGWTPISWLHALMWMRVAIRLAWGSLFPIWRWKLVWNSQVLVCVWFAVCVAFHLNVSVDTSVFFHFVLSAIKHTIIATQEQRAGINMAVQEATPLR